MMYVYHRVPSNMKGSILYPLNALKDIDPELYDLHEKKYEGRMEVMKNRIEKLNCLWNDVLHCSALNPSVISEALNKLGKESHLKFFEIPVEILEPENTVVYTHSLRERGAPIPQEDFVEFDPNEVEKYAYLPEETVQYYKETIEAGSNPLLYHLVPHILYKGSIDTTDLKITEL